MWPFKKKENPVPEPEEPAFCDAEGAGSRFCQWQTYVGYANDMCPPCMEEKEGGDGYNCNFYNDHVSIEHSMCRSDGTAWHRDNISLPVRIAVKVAKHILYYTKGVTQDE
jgi:hypothetical protein